MSHPASAGRTAWMSRSACRRVDPELFFPGNPDHPELGQADLAKAICARCQVRVDCLSYALATGQQYGVWGGATEKERQVMTRAGRYRAYASARVGRPGYWYSASR